MYRLGIDFLTKVYVIMKNILAASLVALFLAACSNTELGESLSSNSSSDGTVSGSDSGTSSPKSDNSTSQSASGVSGSQSAPGDSGAQSGSSDSGSGDSRSGSGSQSGSKGSGSGESKVKFAAEDPGSQSSSGDSGSQSDNRNADGKSVSKGSSKDSGSISGGDSGSGDSGSQSDDRNADGKSVSKGSSKDSRSTSGPESTSGSDSQSVTEYKGGDNFTPNEERQFVTQVGDRVFFGYDRHTLTPDAVKTLKAQVKWLKDKPDVKIVIEGHADERGTREYNLALGERRANSIRAFLVSSGIAKDRILIVSYGKERPAVAASNEAAWAQNRRGVTVLGD